MVENEHASVSPDAIERWLRSALTDQTDVAIPGVRQILRRCRDVSEIDRREQCAVFSHQSSTGT
jgi:hypothetical protein